MKTKMMTAILLTLFLASMSSMVFVTPAKAQYLTDPYTAGLWHFDDNAQDSSPNANHGTVYGATYVDGKFGKALSFDGVDDYVNIPDNPSLDITDDITLEAWIWIRSFSTSEGLHMYVVGKDTTSQRSYGIGVDLVWKYPQKPFFIVFDGTTYKVAWGTTTLATETWYHIMGVFYASTGDLKLYLNGVLEPTEPSTMDSIYSGTADLRIGARQYPGHKSFFNGIIDEVRISNIARSPLDVDPDTLNLKSKGKWISAYVTVPGWHLLFKDTFTRTDWTNQEYGVWTVETVDTRQVFEAKSDEVHRGTAIFAGDTSWTDYVLEAKIWTDDTYWGLIYRADATGTTYYDAYLNTAEGKIEIWKHTGGMWTRSNLVKQIPVGGPSILVNTWYKMKVVVAGGNIKVFFALETGAYTDTPQAEFTDTALPYLSGRIGLLFYDISGPSTYVGRFDDVIVTDLSGTILFEEHFDWTVIDGTWNIEDGKLSGYSDAGTGPHYGTAKLKIRTAENFAVERIFAAEVTFMGWNPATSTEWQRVGMIIQKDPAFDTHASTPGKNDWALVIRGDNRLYLLNEYVAWDGFIPFTPTVGTTYRMKMAWDGSTIKGKAWAVGDPEPAWQLSVSWTNVVTDPSIGLYCSYAHAHFDDIILTTYVSEIDINNVVLYNGDNGAVSAVFDPKYEFVTDMFAYAVDVDGEGTLERLVKFDRMEVINGLGPGDYTFTVKAIQLDGTELVYPYAIRLIKPGK